MADNLSVNVTADTSDLRAQLALAQADLRAFGSEVRNTANQIRSSANDNSALRSQLEQVAGQYNRAKAEVASMTAALRDHKAAHDEAAGGIERVNEALTGMTAPLTGAIGGLKEMAEIIGVAFVAERLSEFAKEMGELGEKTLNMAAAVGTTPEKFSLLTTSMQLAGADAETASRTLERLGKNISAALANPASEAGKAFKALGITEDELKKASTDLEYGLRLLAEKFTEFQDTPSKTAAYMAILGRGMENLIPYFRQGGEGLDEFARKARDTGAVLDNQTAKALADTGEKIHLLDATLEGAGVKGFLALKGAIDTAISGLTSFISWVGKAISSAAGLGPAIGAARVSALQDQLADINQQIAAGSQTQTRHGAHGSTITTPALEEGEVHRITHGPRFGQIDTSYDNLATLRARAAELQAQIDQAQEDERQRSTASFGTGGKPVVPPLEKPEKAATGAGGKGDDGYAAFAEGERLKIQEAKGDWNQIDQIYQEWADKAAALYGQDSVQYRRVMVEKTAAQQRAAQQMFEQSEQSYSAQKTIDEAYLAAFKSNMAQMVAQHKITKEQALGFEIEYTAQLHDQERQRLEDLIQSDNLTVADKTRVYLQLLELDARYTAQVEADTAKIAEAQKAAADKFAQPFVQAFDQIGSTMESTVAGMLEGTTTWQQGMQKIFNQVLQDFIKMIGDMLSQWAASGLASLLGQEGGGAGGLGSVLGKAVAGLFGGGGGEGGGDWSSDAESGAGGILGGIAGAIFNPFKLLGSLFGFAKGGVVPSAAGGWVVPSFQGGGILSMLHQNEMVLPAGISTGLQNMIASGGGGGSPIIANFSVSAMDSQDVSKFFRANGAVLVAALNQAMRNGSALRTA